MNEQPPRSSLVAQPVESHLAGAGNGAKSAGDSLQTKANGSSKPVGKRDYVTRSRVEAVRAQLNSRQIAAVADVGRLGIVTGRQIQRLHYGPSAAAGRLARKQTGQLVHWRVLSRLGRIDRAGRPGTHGYVYGAGIVGQRLLDPGRSRYYPRWTPRPSFMRHALAVSELYVSLREAEKTGPLELVAYDTEPRCWRRFFGPGGARSLLKPDALAVVGLGESEYRYFVEMDCATEHRPQIVAKAKTYIRYWQSGREQAEIGIFPYVLWVTPDVERSTILTEALSTLPPEYWQLMVVTTAEEAAVKMATGAFEAMSNREEVT